jgi:hypothetical protein
MAQSFHPWSNQDATGASPTSDSVSVAGQLNEAGSRHGTTDNISTLNGPASTHLGNGLNGLERASTSDECDNIATTGEDSLLLEW